MRANEYKSCMNYIYWKKLNKNTYCYGSDILFCEDNQVGFSNILMPAGFVIHEWSSITKYQGDHREPELPLLKRNVKYRLEINLKCEPAASVLVRIDFYDIHKKMIKSDMLKESGVFECPEDMDYYVIRLVNGGCEKLVFKHLAIRELDNNNYIKCNFSSSSEECNILFVEPVGDTYILPKSKYIKNLKNLTIIAKKHVQNKNIQEINDAIGAGMTVNLIGYGDESNMMAQRILRYCKGAKAYLYSENSGKMRKYSNVEYYGEEIYRNNDVQNMMGRLLRVDFRLKCLPLAKEKGKQQE